MRYKLASHPLLYLRGLDTIDIPLYIRGGVAVIENLASHTFLYYRYWDAIESSTLKSQM